eukprot:TRINITY_DN4055_c0_g4_i1.p1 TRINITY_DN4055_c0_g4~~TRINITY_DN4055_c0_g4_i1.p1  ORF type:complete len:970 (+),score=127.48 TRINITY_DN4055_c0_g4_i1:26-2911(+)
MSSEIPEKLLLLEEQGRYLIYTMYTQRGVLRYGEEHGRAMGSGEGYKKLHAALVRKFPKWDEEQVRKIGVDGIATGCRGHLEKVMNMLYDCFLYLNSVRDMTDIICSELLPETVATGAHLEITHLILNMVSLTARLVLLLRSMDAAKFCIALSQYLQQSTPERIQSVVDMILKYEKPVLALQSDFKQATSLLVGAISGVEKYLQPVDFTSRDMWYCSSTPDPACNMEYRKLLAKGRVVDWVGYCYLVAPWAIREGNGFSNLQSVLTSGYLLPVYGTEVFHHHKEFKEILRRTKLDKDPPGKHLTSTTSERAVSMAAKTRLASRRSLQYWLEKCYKTLSENPRLIPAKAPLALCLCSLACDEVVWCAAHWVHKPITKIAKYVKSDWQDLSIALTAASVSKISKLLTSHQDTIGRYWKKFLSTGYQHALNDSVSDFLVAVSGAGGQDAIPTLESFAENVSEGDHDAARIDWLRCQTRICSKVHPFAVTGKKDCKLFQTAFLLLTDFGMTYIETTLRQTASLSSLWDHSTWFAGVVQNCLENPQLISEVMWLLRIPDSFTDSVHPWAPDSVESSVGASWITYVEGLVSKTLEASMKYAEGAKGDTAAASRLMLGTMLSAVGEDPCVRIYSKVLNVAESLRLALISNERQFLDTVDTGPLGVQTSALRDKISRSHSVFHFWRSVSSTDAVFQVLLSELTAPQSWDRPEDTPPENLYYNLLHRITTGILEHVSVLNSQKQNIGTGRKLSVSSLASQADWEHLVACVGPYGVASIDGVLLQSLEKTLHSLVKAVAFVEENLQSTTDVKKLVTESALVESLSHVASTLAVRTCLYNVETEYPSHREAYLKTLFQTDAWTELRVLPSIMSVMFHHPVWTKSSLHPNMHNAIHTLFSQLPQTPGPYSVFYEKSAGIILAQRQAAKIASKDAHQTFCNQVTFLNRLACRDPDALAKYFPSALLHEVAARKF